MKKRRNKKSDVIDQSVIDRNLAELDHVRWNVLPINGRYAISDTGDVLDLFKNRLVSQCMSKGYLMASLSLGGRARKNYGTHRLVALTWCDPPDEWKILQVNHLDGDKTNNAKNNLEWCNSKENIEHALCNGLVPRVKDVIVYDHRTLAITIHKHSGKAREATGISSSAIKARLSTRNYGMVGGYSFAYLIDAGSFKFPNYTAEAVDRNVLNYQNRRPAAKGYYLKDYRTGTCRKFKTLADISELTGLSITCLNNMLRPKSGIKVRFGYSVVREGCRLDFPNLTEDELWLSVTSIGDGQKNGYRTTELITGEVKRHVKMLDVAKLIGCHLDTITSKGPNMPTEYRGYLIEKITAYKE